MNHTVFAQFEGIPLQTRVELSLMDRYFIFMVLNGFIVVTLSSGLMAAIPQITQNPASAVTLLATQLPAASTFFLTYFVTVAFAGAAGALLQIVALVLYYVKLILLGSTPRSVWGVKSMFPLFQWGKLVSDFELTGALDGEHSADSRLPAQYPSITLLTVIGLAYSIIAPFVCGFACVAFALFWFVYKVRCLGAALWTSPRC